MKRSSPRRSVVPELRGWIRGYTPVIGLRLHLAGAALWIVVTVAVVALGDRGTLRRTWRDLARLDRADAVWLRRFPRWLLAGAAERARIDGGVRFNAGQKLNALFTAVTSTLLLLSGVALIPVNGATLADRATGAGSLPFWREAHRWLTMLVLLPIAGHVFLALAFPSTRPSLGGMLRGRVDPRWAASHHPRWRPPAPDEDRAA